MLVIDNGDAIRGIAEVATQLDFIVNGYVGTTATQLANGQLGSTEGDLYPSGADATVITSITIVNRDSAARTFTLYLKPSSGTSRAITPVSLDLGIGHSFYTDGQRTVVMDKSGNVLTTATVLSHALGGSSHDADTLANLSTKVSDDGVVGLVATQELTNKTLNASVLKGTFTNDGTVVFPAFTLGGTLTLNGKVFDAGSGNAQINTTGSLAGLDIQGSHSVHGSLLRFLHEYTTPDVGGVVGGMVVRGYDGAGTPVMREFGAFAAHYKNVGDGTEEVEFRWTGMTGGVESNLAMTLSGAGLGWFDVGVDVDEYFKVSGTQVVSAQGAAVANPTDAASTQARLIDLLGRLRTHGLIST